MKGLPGNLGNMGGMMKQIQKMQADLQKAAEDAESFTADGQAGGGMVKAVVNGKYQIEPLTINKDIVDPNDVEVLQESIMAAVNLALQNIQERKKSTLEKLTGGMSIPGLF